MKAKYVIMKNPDVWNCSEFVRGSKYPVRYFEDMAVPEAQEYMRHNWSWDRYGEFVEEGWFRIGDVQFNGKGFYFGKHLVPLYTDDPKEEFLARLKYGL